MKRSTDEQVAKALGWEYRKDLKGWLSPELGPPEEAPQHDLLYEAPAFTTSLDAIVAEVEARGLGWRVEVSRPNIAGYREHTGWVVGDKNGKYMRGEAMDRNPATALCAALLAFIEENPRHAD